MFVGQIGAEIYPDMDDMKFGEMLLVCLLAMVCSVGTAPIPNAGMVYLIMLLEAGNIKDEFLQTYGVGLVWVFDWFVDRVETAQNVTSDSFICGILNHYFHGGNGMLSCFMRGMLPEKDDFPQDA